jgi:hypothetical protein
VSRDVVNKADNDTARIGITGIAENTIVLLANAAMRYHEHTLITEAIMVPNVVIKFLAIPIGTSHPVLDQDQFKVRTQLDDLEVISMFALLLEAVFCKTDFGEILLFRRFFFVRRVFVGVRRVLAFLAARKRGHEPCSHDDDQSHTGKQHVRLIWKKYSGDVRIVGKGET